MQGEVGEVDIGEILWAPRISHGLEFEIHGAIEGLETRGDMSMMENTLGSKPVEVG